jgi:uncharacterized membrane protein
MNQADSVHRPLLVRLVLRLEALRALDAPAAALRPLASALVADRHVAGALRGSHVGHAVHPPLTDVPIGVWTSATVLDLVGGPQARPAAQRLVGVGLLSALPTAVTGLAEWAGTGRRDQRVGVVHALVNVVALVLYTASWLARRRQQHAQGVALALAGATAAGAGGFLGGHLAEARRVASRHPAFTDGPA